MKKTIFLTIVALLNTSGLAPGATRLVPYEYATIQAAIDDSNDCDTIIVQPGSYTENINFLGTNLTLTSTRHTDPNIVARTIIDGNASGSVVTFNGTESPECILRGFTITGGRQVSGGGIYGNRTMATIEHNLIIGNTATGGTNWDGKGGGIYACDGIIRNNIIADNLALYKGGGIYALDGIIKNNLIFGNCAQISGGGGICSTGNYPSYRSCPIITNCTIVNNTTGICCTGTDGQGGGVYCLKGNYHIITNCILWGNVANCGPEIALVDYSIDPVEPMVSLTITYSDIQGGHAMVYTQGYCDLVWGGGNIDADPCFADPCNGDYHLKSQAGRWDANEGRWTKDDVTSPCIDAGDIYSPIGYEPFPNGGRINMGAYGGTAEASKSYFGRPVCETIVAGDINGDCEVNFKDFALMALHWLECIEPNQGPWHLVEDDTEDSYSCEGNFDVSFPCSNAVDEDWDIYALPADGGAASIIYENYIIPAGIAMADFTIKYRQTAPVTPGLCTNVTDYWDGSTWKELNCTALTTQISTLTVRIPDDALSGSALQLRTRIWKSLGIPGSGSGMYYEGKVIWYLLPVCQTIVAGDKKANEK
ncbi:MAG TPA: hypothetical protein HPP66_12455 [Planctomycetes bacterium]|nr:hypothetical protein [Planctomycetota bacterium]